MPPRPRSARAKPARSKRNYRAVLEPYAFGELLWYFGLSSPGRAGPPRGSQLPGGTARRTGAPPVVLARRRRARPARPPQGVRPGGSAQAARPDRRGRRRPRRGLGPPDRGPRRPEVNRARSPARSQAHGPIPSICPSRAVTRRWTTSPSASATASMSPGSTT